MARPRIVLVHGYSDQGASFMPWRNALKSRNFDVTTIGICTYKTLTNEISLDDLAEAFNRALAQEGLDGGEPFDAIVHSTGMLVVRAWLSRYSGRRHRLKRLIGLAPATFGSPLAHLGRSFIGAMVKGNPEHGPDFGEAGDRILDALELGSRFTWDLAHRDMVCPEPFYGPEADTPYVFTLVGNEPCSWIRRRFVGEGTDGTVRWAGCALNTRKIILDLTISRDHDPMGDRIRIAPWSNAATSLVMVDGVNHSTILSNPEPSLDLVAQALNVDSLPSYTAWNVTAAKASEPAFRKIDQWQQFVVRAVDERGDPIPDYNLQLVSGDGKRVDEFDMEVDTYSEDRSLRCFHVNLTKLNPQALTKLYLNVMALSGTALVDYYGFGSETREDVHPDGKWDAALDISPLLKESTVKLFWPFTTTLIELRMNREPNPPTGVPDICRFMAIP